MRRALTLALCSGLLAAPALAIDPCLVGVWEADGADMAQAMSDQMLATVSHLSGRTSIEIDAFGSLKLLSEEMRFAIKVPGQPEFTVTVAGFAEGSMDADDGGSFIANLPDYDLVGRARIFGEVIEIPVYPDMPGTEPGRASGLYGCSGESASFDSETGPIPRRWQRVR